MDTAEADLFDMIYAAALHERPWMDFISRINAQLPNGKTTFMVLEKNAARASVGFNTGFDEAELALFNSYYGAVNPWMPQAAIRPAGKGVVAEQMLPRADLYQTEFYNDYLRRIGCISGIGLTVTRDRTRSFILTTLTASTSIRANRRSANLLTRLSPHLKRGVDLYQRQKLITAAAAAEPLLAAAGIGVLSVTRDRRMKSANMAAQDYIGRGCGLRLSPQGRISVPDPDAAAVLAAQLTPGNTGTPVASFYFNGAHGRFRLSFIRLAGDEVSSFLDGPCVTVIIEKAWHLPPESSTNLFASHGLTQAEMRVATRLSRGETVNQIAEAHQVSRETIRSQVKSLYMKLGISRQTELVRLAAGLPDPSFC